jgi:hypothetical protein
MRTLSPSIKADKTKAAAKLPKEKKKKHWTQWSNMNLSKTLTNEKE